MAGPPAAAAAPAEAVTPLGVTSGRSSWVLWLESGAPVSLPLLQLLHGTEGEHASDNQAGFLTLLCVFPILLITCSYPNARYAYLC